jgi:hypothetical protein
MDGVEQMKKLKNKRSMNIHKYKAEQKKETTDFIIQISGMSVTPTDILSICCKIPNRIIRRMK